MLDLRQNSSAVLGIALAVGEGLGGLGAVLAGLAGEISLSYALVFGAGVALLAGVVVLLKPTGHGIKLGTN